MPDPAAHPHAPRILGSFAAAGMSWIAIFLMLLGWIALGLGGGALRGSLVALALTTAIPVFGLWLILLLPLTLLVPADSSFWRPPICILAGALFGAMLAMLIPDAHGLGLIGGIAGGILFVAAALAARRGGANSG